MYRFALIVGVGLTLLFPVPALAKSTPKCRCTSIYRPVCGANGKTYRNKCRAHCSDVLIRFNRRCRPPILCRCSKVYRPVCGTNGRTYINRCRARCRGVSIAYYGRCQVGGCYCSHHYRPVCGSNGRTYRNACLARCAGTGVWYYGRCYYYRPYYPPLPRTCPKGCKRTSYGPCQCPIR